MSTTTPITAEQLAALSDNGRRHELVNGELSMRSPAGGQHGRIAMRIGRMLGNHVEQHDLGEVFAAETGFLLKRDPDTVRAPDAAFVNATAYNRVKETQGYLPLAPDLAIEVVSPNDTSSQVEEKAHFWLAHGVKMVLVLDPDNRSVRAYRKTSPIEVHFAGDTIEVDAVVPGWNFSVDDVFIF